MFFCRNSALSSKLTLASQTTMSPSGVSATGFTSNCVQSHPKNIPYRLVISVTALSCGSVPSSNPILVAILFAASSINPTSISIGSVKINSGLFLATSSMEVPPRGLPTRRGPPVFLSIKMDKYISLRMYILSIKKTFWQRIPLGACFVTSSCPSIWDAISPAWPFLVTIWTPPLKPFLKVPRPRPPERTWALMTTSLRGCPGLFIWVRKMCSASSGVLATKPLGVAMP
mmetsp:Transcript_39136/g.66718  ORF Transcript_39136/g.66718 Transcript_39136/m.66718 type:complete len:229 (-) Transcript_39136:49-735(-)